MIEQSLHSCTELLIEFRLRALGDSIGGGVQFSFRGIADHGELDRQAIRVGPLEGDQLRLPLYNLFELREPAQSKRKVVLFVSILPLNIRNQTAYLCTPEFTLVGPTISPM